jgi:iron complex outermembrane recepter protein
VHKRNTSWYFWLIVLLLDPGDVQAQQAVLLEGQTLDAVHGRPIGNVIIEAEEIQRTTTSDARGRFHFTAVAPGRLHLKVWRLGYETQRFPVEIGAGPQTHLVLRLSSLPFELGGIVIRDEKMPESRLDRPPIVVGGKKLRQNLGGTIAATIANEPGLAQRSMGPAPARPVLRGLGGDRLLVLEDGERTGDLSAAASDHAVAIEPLTTRRIELSRGPRAFLYGSSVLGGVINVIRDYVPSRSPDRWGGGLTWQGESGNNGLGSGLALHGPWGPLTWRVDGSWRRAANTATPQGRLINTAIRTGNTSAGFSLVRPWGYIGTAAGLYDSEYGIPPDPDGGHPRGISIGLNRRHAEIRAEITAPLPPIQSLRLHYTFSRYRHTETEASGDIGLAFGVLQHNAGATFDLAPPGALGHGVVGLWYEYRNYATAGLSFTPPASEYAGALFVYQELPLKNWDFSAALRLDGRIIDPRRRQFSSTVGLIQQRRFAGLSGAWDGRYRFGGGIEAGVILTRSFRPPGIEEIFSEGPHLASYAYEVGNANLDSENGLGLETFIEATQSWGQVNLALFRNDIRGFIFPQNTGQFSPRRGDLPLYRMVGLHARMWGFETTFQWRIGPSWKVEATAGHVRGKIIGSSQALPNLPPLNGKASLEFSPVDSFSLGIGLRSAAAQRRTGAFEVATAGYTVADLDLDFRFATAGLLHTLSLHLDNAGDTEYRRHLNRIRQVMPEPGRSLRLLHQVLF